jgi:hypothetical protein
MGNRQIKWSHRAEIKLFVILEFYTERNKSTQYSKKLYKKFTRNLALLNKQPDLGIGTEIESVRGLIVEDFILFYEATPHTIFVHTIRDCRQNPNDLRIL